VDLGDRAHFVTSTRVLRLSATQQKTATLREEIERLNALNARMMASEDKQISPTDPDARSMATWQRDRRLHRAKRREYDASSHPAHEVTNVRTNRSQLSNMAEQARMEIGNRNALCRGWWVLRRPGDTGLRDGRHHDHATEADDFECQGRGPLRQA
jgi:hypothetical protein